MSLSMPDEPPHFREIGKLKYFSNQLLGKGAFAHVYKGEFENSVVAIKRIQLDPNEKSAIEAELRLVHFGKDTWHENLIRYLHKEGDANFSYIAMELCVGTLEDLISKTQNVPSPGPNEEILRQMTEGLQYLHSKQILHRNVKPKNILITERGIVKLGGFGLYKEKRQGAMSFSFTRAEGSQGWVAPELFKGAAKFSFAADIFSLGCVFCYVLTGGIHPFGEPIERAMNIVQGEFKKKVLGSIEDKEFRKLTRKMISAQPKNRPDFQEIQVKLLECLLRIYTAHLDGREDDFIKTIDTITTIDIASDHTTPWIRKSMLISICKANSKRCVECAQKVIGATNTLKIDVTSSDSLDCNALTALLDNPAVELVDMMELIKLLIAKGIDVKKRTAIYGDTPINVAIFNFGVRRQDKGLPIVLELLMKSGADPNVCNDDGWSAINLACRFYRKDNLIDVLRLLIVHNGRPDRRSTCGNNGATLVAQYYQQANISDILKLLIEAGADVNCRVNKDGWNTFMLLVNYYEDLKKFNTATKLLVSKGINLKDIINSGLNLLKPSVQELTVTKLFKIFSYVSKSDLGQIKRECGGKLNNTDEFGRTPLHYVCMFYKGKDLHLVLRLLIESGAKVDVCDVGGRNALHLACANYNGKDLSQVIRVLIEGGAEADICDKNGGNALHIACENYKRKDLSQVTQVLIEGGAVADVYDECHRNPLHYACANYKGEDLSQVIRLLIEGGAKPDVYDKCLRNPLHYACANYKREDLSQVIRLLLEGGVKPDVYSYDHILGHNYSLNPLHSVCMLYEGADFSQVIRLLVDCGAKADICDKDGRNPLHLACWKYKGKDLSQVIRMLFVGGAKADVCDHEGRNPLHFACENYNGKDLSRVIQLLFERGAKADVCDIHGRNPLHFACANYKGEDLGKLIQMLIENGANPDVFDADGRNPLHYACANYNEEHLSHVIRILIEGGAKADVCDKYGGNSVHFACANYEGEDLDQVIRVLTDGGAKADVCDVDGRNPLHYACANFKEEGLSRVVRVLTDSGAKADVCDVDGRNPLHYACANYKEDDLSQVIRVLIKSGAKADVCDKYGWGLLEYARKKNQSKEVIQLLTECRTRRVE